MGAVIEKVKEGSAADKEGQLRPGKRITKFESTGSENCRSAQESRRSLAEITMHRGYKRKARNFIYDHHTSGIR